jgi:hypothetical protein
MMLNPYPENSTSVVIAEGTNSTVGSALSFYSGRAGRHLTPGKKSRAARACRFPAGTSAAG